jgi:hypothetical protein
MDPKQARHKKVVERKYQRILMYNALIDSWEMRDDADYEYLADVRKRLHQAESQLKNMQP